MRREGENVVLHGALRPTHAINPGFVQRLLVVPSVVRDPIAGGDGSRSIRPTPAVQEDGPASAVVQDMQDRGNLLFRWSTRSSHWHVKVTHAFFLNSARFHLALGSITKVHNRSHAELGQIMKALRRRLTAAIDVLIDRMEVRNAGNLQLGALGTRQEDGQDGEPKCPTLHVPLGCHKKTAGCQKVRVWPRNPPPSWLVPNAKHALASMSVTQAC